MNQPALASRHCVPCRGGVAPLSAAEAEARWSEIPLWTLRDAARRIERHFTFRTFAQALAFVNRIAAIAEGEDHHPDISFGWGYATVSLQTHAIKGLHDNDFIMAARIDAASAG